MSKILNIRLPASATTTEFKPGDFNQLKEAINQIVFQLNSTYTPVSSENNLAARGWMAAGAGAGGGFAGHVTGFQNSTGIRLPHALLMSDADQANAGVTSENLITYNTPVMEYDIYRDPSNPSRIYFNSPGQYLINVKAQAVNKDNAVHELNLWAKNTGVNYPLSNTRFDVPVRKSAAIWGHTTAITAGIFTVEDPTSEYLEMAWQADSTLVSLESYAAGTTPTRPATPSVVLTASYVSTATS